MRCKPQVLLLLLIPILIASKIVIGDEPSRDQHPSPVPLIFDTDIGNDVDDVLALGMIHAFESRGECKLIAVTVTKDHPLAGPFTDAINTFYNRGDIPIGVCRSGVTPDEGKFIGMASQMDGDSSRYPHDLLSGENAPDAVQVLRRALASAEDGTVVIAQVGFSTNLANLMDSKPDEISPLGGLALVKQKVRLLSVMAGAFTQIIGDKGKPYDHQEYNVVQDIPSAKSIATRWPTPILWSGFEIGLALGYPAVSIANDYRYASPHPLKEAYLLYCGPNHDRPTWDLTSVLVAIRPDRQYFDRSPVGTVTVQDNGLTTFEASESGRHQYLVLPENGQKQVLESLMLLSSEPPH